MVAALRGVSRHPKPHESALPGLDQGAVERLPRKVELGHDLAVPLHSALGDQAASLTRRSDTEVLDENRRQVHLPLAGENGFNT